MSLVPCQLWIPILWLGTRGHKTSYFQMTGWFRVGSVYPILFLYVVVSWGTPVHFTYMCSLLHYSYTAITVPPVGYPYACTNVSTFSWTYSYLIPPTRSHGSNWVIYRPVPHKFPSALTCGVVDVPLTEVWNYIPLTHYFPFHYLHYQGLKVIPQNGSLCPCIIW